MDRCNGIAVFPVFVNKWLSRKTNIQYSVASTLSMSGSVFMWRFRLVGDSVDFLNFKSNVVSSWSPSQGENRTRLYCAYVFLYMLPILPDNYETTLDFLLFFSNFLIVRIFSLAPPSTSLLYCTDRFFKTISTLIQLKGIVSRDRGGLESILLDR